MQVVGNSKGDREESWFAHPVRYRYNSFYHSPGHQLEPQREQYNPSPHQTPESHTATTRHDLNPPSATHLLIHPPSPQPYQHLEADRQESQFSYPIHTPSSHIQLTHPLKLNTVRDTLQHHTTHRLHPPQPERPPISSASPPIFRLGGGVAPWAE